MGGGEQWEVVGSGMQAAVRCGQQWEARRSEGKKRKEKGREGKEREGKGREGKGFLRFLNIWLFENPSSL